MHISSLQVAAITSATINNHMQTHYHDSKAPRREERYGKESHGYILKFEINQFEEIELLQYTYPAVSTVGTVALIDYTLTFISCIGTTILYSRNQFSRVGQVNVQLEDENWNHMSFCLQNNIFGSIHKSAYRPYLSFSIAAYC